MQPYSGQKKAGCGQLRTGAIQANQWCLDASSTRWKHRICRKYDPSVLAREFPALSTCKQQAFSRWHTMNVDDQSNLCSMGTRAITNTRCLHKQGLFATQESNLLGVTTEELHGQGIPTTTNDFLIQSLFPPLANNNNGG
jgi:hypothetical protein